jgi:hypothetical protein
MDFGEEYLSTAKKQNTQRMNRDAPLSVLPLRIPFLGGAKEINEFTEAVIADFISSLAWLHQNAETLGEFATGLRRTSLGLALTIQPERGVYAAESPTDRATLVEAGILGICRGFCSLKA